MMSIETVLLHVPLNFWYLPIQILHLDFTSRLYHFSLLGYSSSVIYFLIFYFIWCDAAHFGPYFDATKLLYLDHIQSAYKSPSIDWSVLRSASFFLSFFFFFLPITLFVLSCHYCGNENAQPGVPRSTPRRFHALRPSRPAVLLKFPAIFPVFLILYLYFTLK